MLKVRDFLLIIVLIEWLIVGAVGIAVGNKMLQGSAGIPVGAPIEWRSLDGDNDANSINWNWDFASAAVDSGGR